MKRIYLFYSMFLLLAQFATAQHKISGKIFDSNQNPIHGAIVYLNSDKWQTTTTDEFGYYEFKNEPSQTYIIKSKYIGYDNFSLTFTLQKDTVINILLQQNDFNDLDKIIVSATRAGQNNPVAFTNFTKDQIQNKNYGQDVPYLLKNLPSILVTSDGGTGIGYTQMWIRGTDVTRINVTINGIPLNDPESHGVWWVDVPDIMSVTDDLQIQRGIGSSTNGSGAFGATINFRTNKLNTEPYVQTSTTYGSFNTLKNSVSIGTGTINKHFVFEGHFSKSYSDGYIDRAWSNLHSLYLSGTYFDNKTLVKATFFKGFEETYQAWYGVPFDSLKTNRTFNHYTYDNQIDHYEQTHANIHIVRKITNKIHANITGFYIHGAGYYEEYKDNDNLANYGLSPIIIGNDTITNENIIRRKLMANNFFGANYNLTYQSKKLSIILGGEWNDYLGSHYGNIIWMQYAANIPIRYQWNTNTGDKKDFNSYIRINYSLWQKLNLTADLQYRTINYVMSGTNDDLSNIDVNVKYPFFNPKAGLSYQFNKNTLTYFSFGHTSKEPKRDDFIDATANNQPVQETLNDYELGFKLNGQILIFEANAYFMDYVNQLILTGKINDVGNPIVTNVPKSYRRGIELIFTTRIDNFIRWNANVSLSQNKILNFTEYVDDWDTYPQQVQNNLGTTDIAFSPSIIANSVITFKITKFFDVVFASQYVSRRYIDNTSSIDRSLNPYLVNDLTIHSYFTTKVIKNISLSLKVNNIFNADYITNAWGYSYYYGSERYFDAGYYPQAFRNYLLNLSLTF